MAPKQISLSLAVAATLNLIFALTTQARPAYVSDQSGDGASPITAGGAGADAISANAASVVGGGGSSQSAGSLSSGAIAAICIIAGLIVVVGIFTGVLWYQAKKRDWTMKEGLVASTRVMAAAVATPLSAVFPKSPGLNKMKSMTSMKSEFNGRASLRRQTSMASVTKKRTNTGGSIKMGGLKSQGSQSKLRMVESRDGEDEYPFSVDADEKIRGLKAQEESRTREKNSPIGSRQVRR